MMLFADEATVVKFGDDRDRISRIINNDFTTLDGWGYQRCMLFIAIKIVSMFFTRKK